MYIRRDALLQKLKRKMNNGMVKIITGVRRSGKSFLLFRIFYDYLKSIGVDDDHIISLALDELENEKYTDCSVLSAYLESRITDEKKYFILLDEVQFAISKEEKKNPEAYLKIYSVLNGLLKKGNVDVYVTGSNSKFLSVDVRTEFRGRGDEVFVSPLTFREFHEARKIDVQEAFREYEMYGGLPAILMQKEEQDKVDYLTKLFTETYFKDIIGRYTIEREDILFELTDFLCSSSGSLTNINRIKDTINTVQKNKKSESVSYPTLKAYVDYLKDSFLFSEARRYDIIGKKYFSSLSKFYCIDTGLRNSRLNMRQIEETHLMETILYNDLIARGFSVDVGMIEKSRRNKENKVVEVKYEIDFVINKGMYQYYIQSAYALESEQKSEKELKPFSIVNNSFKKIVVTRYGVKPWYDESGIMHVSITDFLLRDDILV